MRHTKINDTTYAVYDGSVTSYLLIGERAMMIDSGMTFRNIRTYAEKLAGKPVEEVINTHGHFDHTAGNRFFKKVYMSPAFAEKKKTRWETEAVSDGSIINLGGKTLQIISVPAHSSDSIAILDIDERTLFTGDEVVENQILLIPLMPGDKKIAVQTHKENMEKLLNMSEYFDIVCPAHAATPLPKTIIENYIQADKNIMEGAEGKKWIYSKTFYFAPPKKTYRRYEYKNTGIIYSSDCIFVPREKELMSS